MRRMTAVRVKMGRSEVVRRMRRLAVVGYDRWKWVGKKGMLWRISIVSV